MSLTSRPIRIGVLGVRGIPSTYSGYETFLTVMLPELARRGHDVTIYTRGEEFEATPWEGVKRVPLPSVSTKSLETLSHSALGVVFSRLRGRHDVLFCCNVATALFTGVAQFTGQPVVINVDGVEWIRGKWGPLAQKTFKTAARMSKYVATTLIADCQAMADLYKDEFNADSVVIPYCWTGLTDLGDAEGRRSMLAELGLEPRSYCVVAGRLNPENNIERIARSYAESDNEQTLVVLGAANYDSPTERAIRELVARDDRIRFEGHISSRELFGALLAEASVYFHGHSVGGMNPGLVEAMGSGALIAAFGTNFNRDTVAESGVFFENPDTAAQEVFAALEGRDSEALRASARHRATDTFSLERVADLYEATLVAAAKR